MSLTAGVLLLGLAALVLDLLVAALGQLRRWLKRHLGPKHVWRGGNEAEGAVLGRGVKGVVRGGEVEDGATRGGFVRARVAQAARSVGDATSLSEREKGAKGVEVGRCWYRSLRRRGGAPGRRWESSEEHHGEAAAKLGRGGELVRAVLPMRSRRWKMEQPTSKVNEKDSQFGRILVHLSLFY